jgi:hypothetical protein
MLFVRLFLVFLSGIAAHQSYGPTRRFGTRWGSILRYAIGIVLFIPSQIIVKASIPREIPGDLWGEVERDITAGLLAAGAVGTGVLAGHMLDGDAERK